jgi:branched-subunit amino acid aminotransferase/4-amino-4-deoxychorismate lyase
VRAGAGDYQARKNWYEHATAHSSSSEKVGPNVVSGVMPDQIGLIETIRVREGLLPWLGRHLTRLRASLAALGAPEPPPELADLVRFAAGAGDRVVRVELTDGHAAIATREVNSERAIRIVVSPEMHRPYPHKTTRREQFGRALAGARRAGAHDAVLVTAQGFVAEGTAWNLFWWDKGNLCTPAAALGILPGLGRERIMELADVTEQQVPVAAIAGRSLFLVNAVRGIVEIDVFEGTPVRRDPRTAELARSFWPVGNQD